MNSLISHLNNRAIVYDKILSDYAFITVVNDLYTKIRETILRGGKLLLCGNGGSAADCQHIAGEFVGRLTKERNAWPALTLCSDVAVMTCLGNDYTYDNIFKRQIEAHGSEKDLLLALSTSGNSNNICVAIQTAKEKNILTYSITNYIGGKMAELSDYILKIPSENGQIVQEITMMVFHIICEMLEHDETI
ncbi:MAG: SIS domain-containing protein [Oscillospiraceae bacterium]|jgi:D-sedoheptulose 7-phosphate isomerase|nr:SIS domain-containing protein [Oscillospiraceae bacterium]